MPVFEINDGENKYRVTAPDQETAIAAFKSMVDADAPPATPIGTNGLMDASRAASSGMMQGMTLGFGDELEAGVFAVPEAIGGMFKGQGFDLGKGYQSALDRARGTNEQIAAQNPLASGIGSVAGNLVSGAGLAKGGLTMMGMKPASVWAQTALGAAEGGVFGGVQGFGTGDSIEDRGQRALEGMGWGAALGAPLGAVGGMLAKGGWGGAQRASGMTPQADDALVDALDGAPPTPITAADDMLADRTPMGRDLLDVAIQRSGKPAKLARDAIEARAAKANNTVADALNRTMGTPTGLATLNIANRVGTASNRRHAYDAAYAAPVDYSGEAGITIEALLTRVPGDIISKANRMMRLEGAESAEILARVADNGTVTFDKLPGVQQLDYITRALNQAAKTGDGAGALGGQTDIGRLYVNLAREIRTNLKAAVPEYGAALQVAAQPIQRREALEFGAELLSSKVPRDVVAEELAGMSKPQLIAVREGIRGQIDEALANVRALISDPNMDARQVKKALDDMSSAAAREKLTLALGTDAQEVFDALDEAARALLLRASVTTGSRTFVRTALNDAIQQRLSGGVINAALEGKPLNATQRIVQQLSGHTPAANQAKEQAIFGEIADALTKQGPSAQKLADSLGKPSWDKRNSILNALLAGQATFSGGYLPSGGGGGY